jgi:hypothetical protein
LRHSTLVSALTLALVLIGCTTHQQSDTSTSPSPAAVATTSPAVAATDIPSAAPTAVAVTTATPPSGPTPVSTPTPTPNPNLLDVANGTILRSYSPATIDDENDGNLGNYAVNPSDELPATATPPYTFVFEFPGVATITGFTATMANPPDSGGPGPSVTIAVSTTGANAGFNDVGTMTSDKTSTSKTLAANVKARWVRVIANGHLYYRIGATGTVGPPPAPVNPIGTYIEEARPEKNGGFVMSGTIQNDERVRFVAVGSGVTATECTGSDLRATFIGEFQGRNWNAVSAGNKDANPDSARTSINDEGTIIAGARFGGPIVFMRTSDNPAFCAPRVNGTGLHHVLVLDQDPPNPWYPADSTPPLAGYQFSAIGAGMLDANALAGQEAVITRGVCSLPQLLSAEQIALLNGWVAAGHKLIISSGG